MPLLLWQISLSDDVAMLQEIWSFDLSDYQTINLNVKDVKMNFSYLGNARQHFLLWVCSWDNRMNLFPHEGHWWDQNWVPVFQSYNNLVQEAFNNMKTHTHTHTHTHTSRHVTEHTKIS